ncbi:MAG: MogA/MoaB family molybdenum cofactor biosynthesis protein [Methanotrichaceae archaeon]
MIIDVFIVSTSRFQKFGPVQEPSQAEDLSGKIILENVASAGYDHNYRLLPDGIESVREAVLETKADAVVICGGTGLAPQDLTIEAVEPIFEKSIPGFGEVFRLKSLEDVGTRVILTRASAGVVRGVPVFCLPGSPSAAKLGTKLILTELEHILLHLSE